MNNHNLKFHLIGWKTKANETKHCVEKICEQSKSHSESKDSKFATITFTHLRVFTCLAWKGEPMQLLNVPKKMCKKF